MNIDDIKAIIAKTKIENLNFSRKKHETNIHTYTLYA